LSRSSCACCTATGISPPAQGASCLPRMLVCRSSFLSAPPALLRTPDAHLPGGLVLGATFRPAYSFRGDEGHVAVPDSSRRSNCARTTKAFGSLLGAHRRQRTVRMTANGQTILVPGSVPGSAPTACRRQSIQMPIARQCRQGLLDLGRDLDDVEVHGYDTAQAHVESHLLESGD